MGIWQCRLVGGMCNDLRENNVVFSQILVTQRGWFFRLTKAPNQKGNAPIQVLFCLEVGVD